MDKQIIVSQRKDNFRKNLHLLIKYRELMVVWTQREIRARYRQSILGVGWALVQPLVQMIVISVVFGYFLNVSSGDYPYPIFVYVAILPWSLFASSIISAIPSIINNIDLVTKIYFPREILPISAVLARLMDFLIASLVFVVLMAVYKVKVYPTLIFVPILLAIQITLAIGLGLLGSAISVFLRDITFAIPLVMQIWMYASPVIYPMSTVPENLQKLYLLNPMAGIIDSYRRVVLDGKMPDLNLLSISAIISLLLCIFGYFYFKRLEMAMSDII